nr:glycosyltransferase family A protein [Desulfobacteraceae bacterium]
MKPESNKIYRDAPLVSVYIPSRNYAHYLTQSVESVQNQLYPNWELFIVDDASDDATAVIAENLRKRDPGRIKVILNKSPMGLQRIANKILHQAHGRYIVRLDADDWFEESALLVMAAKLESDSKLGLVYGHYF